MATSKAVNAGQSVRQDDIIIAANLGRKATSDLLEICKSSFDRTHDRSLQQRLLENGRQCVKSYQDLLETIRQMIDQPSIEQKHKLVQHSRSIAQTIQSLVQCAELWKSLAIDHDDPTDVAEHELLHAAQSIESAAKKLSSLKPRRTVQVRIRQIFSSTNTSIHFVDMLDIWLFDEQFNRMLFISTE